MRYRVLRQVAWSSFILLLSASLSGALLHAAPNVLGRVASDHVLLEGLPVTSGALVVDGSLVSTGPEPGVIELSSGRVLVLARHSEASLTGGALGEVRLAVHAGTVAFRSASGAIASVQPEDAVSFDQEGEIGEGREVMRGDTGPEVVALLTGAARRGAGRIEVDSVANISQVTDGRLVLRSADSQVQQLACMKTVKDVSEAKVNAGKFPSVSLHDGLYADVAANDAVVQGASSHTGAAGVVAETESSINAGTTAIDVADASRVDPWRKVLVRSPDARRQEVRCVRAVIGAAAAGRDPRGGTSPYVLLADSLSYSYSGAALLQGETGSAEGTVASLASSSSSGASTITVEDPAGLDPLADILLRSADGSRQEVHCIRSVDGVTIALSDSLESDFAAGAEVVQGRGVQQALAQGLAVDRTANCNCCEPPGGAVLIADRKLAALLAGAGLAVIAAEEIDDDVPPASPIEPNPLGN